jgi:membrane protease YdiL (CAAX protease family)
MTQEESLLRRRLKAPKAAAIAGIVFSVLLIISLVLLLIAVPANPREGGAWLSTSRNTILLALNLVPFSGIAFLWFIGVVRDRLGALRDSEQRLFDPLATGNLPQNGEVTTGHKM